MAGSDHSNASGTPLGTTQGHASHMSLSNIQSRAPTVVTAPRSPTQSVHAFLEPPTQKGNLNQTPTLNLSLASSRAPSSASDSSQASTKALKSARGRKFSEEKEVVLTRDGMPSPISTSPILTTPILTAAPLSPLSPPSPLRDDNEEKDGFMRAMRTRIGSVGTLGAFAPSPDRAYAIASSPTVGPSLTRSQAVGPALTRTQATVPSPTRTQAVVPSPTESQAASSAALELENARRVSKLLTAKEAPAPGLEGDRETQETSPGQESIDEGSIQADSPVIIAAARQAKASRAQMINHTPSIRRANSKAARVLCGERDAAIQEQGGIVLPPHVESPESEPEFSSNAGKKPSNSDGIEMDNLPPKRPERPRRNPTLDEEEADSVPALGVAPSATRRFSIFDALRSNPPDPAMIPKRASTAPSRRRKPTFTEDTTLDLQVAKKFDRENVVSTPYPTPEGQKGMRFEKLRVWREGEGYEGLRRELKKGEILARGRGEAGIGVTVVLYSRGQAAPGVGEIMIPVSVSSRPNTLLPSEPHPHTDGPAAEVANERDQSEEPGTASADTLVLVPAPRAKGKLVKKNMRFKALPPPPAPFDDEALARVLRAEYCRLRGLLRVCFGARALQGLRVLSYSYLSTLSSLSSGNAAKPFRPRTSTSNGDGGGDGDGDGDGNGDRDGDGARAREEGNAMEAQLQILLLSPKKGRGTTVVVDWLRAQLEERKTSASNKKLALCFQEEWCAGSLAVGFGGILALSVLATLLWVFLPVNSDGGMVRGGMRGPAGGNFVFEGGGAAGGVEGAVGIGLLILLLGWTGMAGWVVLSWLIM
ncbi:hypothetical protein MMC30_006514 [Trapelia coarctata]|nr:hypothetical protein [Trapelia coarctata]